MLPAVRRASCSCLRVTDCCIYCKLQVNVMCMGMDCSPLICCSPQVAWSTCLCCLALASSVLVPAGASLPLPSAWPAVTCSA